MVDIALLQKPNDEGLTRHETSVLCGMVTKEGTSEVFPLDLQVEKQECAALGFISTRAARLLDYDYSDLNKFIERILDDIDLENPTGVYHFKELDILLLN